MSLIEKAVERLDRLKRGDVPEGGALAELVERKVMEWPETLAGERAEEQVQPGPSARADDFLRDKGREQDASGAVSEMIRLDLARLGTMGMVTPDQSRSPIAEEYRVVKRPLIRNVQGKGTTPVESANLIMVTSALPGEGKSFTAINLAMSIAMELDNTVLLVDADFARPSVLPRLGLPPRKGLMDVLVGEVSDLSEVMLRTNVEKLSILPAGMTNQRSTELIASDAMTRMLEEMATRYSERIIVFDSPPLLSTTEARVLASHMGQIVMVVESGRTTHGAVKQALTTIENCPVKLLVLNKATEVGRTGLYGYGYGYGYGADARSEERA
jgi:protein-tyrosine kinase